MVLVERVRALGLFKSSSDDFVATVASIATPHSNPRGSQILIQGQSNDRLLLLLSGEVEVIVDGERVAILKTPGDLLGEISVLVGLPVIATLQAVTDVEVLELPAKKIENAIKSSPNSFGYQLYRLLSSVLSEKIINTNQKARQFEIANRALVETNRGLDERIQERERQLKSLTEQTIRSSKVLIIEPDKKQQTLSKMALGGTGVQLTIAGSDEEARTAIQTEARFDLIFISSTLVSSIKDLRDLQPDARFIYITSSDMRSELPALESCASSLSNIISRNVEDRVFTVKHSATTITKLLSKDLFGIEKYLNWGVAIQKHVVKSSCERPKLIEAMQNHMADLGVRSAITDRIGTVAEELLMNAIYDAPHSADGKALYAHMNRTDDVQLKEGETAEFRFAVDGMMAAISVADPFGGFRASTLMNYLKKNYAGDSQVQEAGKGGAGRGLHQIVENSDLVIFNVKSGVKTEVIALFNLDPKSKHQESNPTFHFFSE
ncbi:MAG TPA: cyclic nucleotide-binding domain-containing protein [Bdellovibrionales bacterium]|nr:cyclic nucleotide-binding domain-containing protein [Bdellovibrionales bacterium]